MRGPSIDVAVVGGGPGGSAAATLLAQQGWRVVLLEREQFPRPHVGESLLPASLPILRDLGVLEAVAAAGFVRKLGATMVWGADPDPWSWYFRETNRSYPHSYQVERDRFDQLLLENAAAAGVDVRQGERVSSVEFLGGGVRLQAESSPVAARFVVDASGQAGLLARQLRLRQNDAFFQNLAVYAYFDGAAHLPAPDEGNIFIESYGQGWVWKIPLSGGRTSVGAVVDHAAGGAAIADLGAEAFLRAQIDQAPRTAALLSAARMSDGPHVARDWSYAATDLVGPSHVLIGDAACFVDPLFSSGVHLALSSAVLGSAYVTTALRRPEMTSAAGQEYSARYLQQYRHFRELARLFYASNHRADSYFWEARRITGGRDSPRHAFVRAVAGQPPQGYERSVLQRGDAPPAFANAVSAVEAVRAEREQRWARLLPAGATLGTAPLLGAIPRLAPGATLERRPVLEAGEFVWADVLTGPDRPEGTPLSALVARLVRSLDRDRPVRELLTALAAEADVDLDAATLVPVALAALRVLYVDGALLIDA